MRYLLPLVLLAGPAAAQDCPPLDAQVARQAAIHDRMQAAGSEAEVRPLAAELWSIWLAAPDPPSQELLDRGMAQRSGFDLFGAQETLTRLIDYCPDYAEGWNQRAFARYLAQDFDGALDDLEEALALNPVHLGALSGKAMTLIGLRRYEEAQQVLRDAVAINPWLSERRLLTEPPGEEL